MKVKKSIGKLVMYSILAVLLFFGLIHLTVVAEGLWLHVQLLSLLVLLLMAFVALVSYTKSWGEDLLFVVFFLYIGNLFFIWLMSDKLYVVLLFLALIGFLLALPKRKRHKVIVQPYYEEKEPHSVVFDPPQKKEIKEPKKDQKKVVPQFVAAKKGKYFYNVRSEGAKKISKTNRVLFASRKAAEEQGYKVHTSVK